MTPVLAQAVDLHDRWDARDRLYAGRVLDRETVASVLWHRNLELDDLEAQATESGTLDAFRGSATYRSLVAILDWWGQR